MNVIKDNYIPKVEIKIVCEDCKSILEYNNNDIKTQSLRVVGKNGTTTFPVLKWIDCPLCGKSNFIGEYRV